MEKMKIKIDQTRLPLGHQKWAGGDGTEFKPHKGKGSFKRKAKNDREWRSMFGLDD